MSIPRRLGCDCVVGRRWSDERYCLTGSAAGVTRAGLEPATYGLKEETRVPMDAHGHPSFTLGMPNGAHWCSSVLGTSAWQ